MQRKLLVFSLLLCFTSIEFAHSQIDNNQMSKPLSHTKQVYVDEARNNLYWPMDLPFWVRLSASPEDGAPSFLLDKVSPRSKVKSKKDMSKGIRLEVPGRQFVRWFNYVTKEELLLQFFADGDAPKSSEALVNAPVFNSGKRMFYGHGLKCVITSSDDFSGVEKTYSSIDGKPFTVYRDTITFDREKDVNLRFYAVDRVGNARKPKVVPFIVDLTKPTSRHETLNNFFMNTLSPGTTIKLTSTDAISGVKRIYYKFDTQTKPSIYQGNRLRLITYRMVCIL